MTTKADCQMMVEKTFKFFDMAAIQRMHDFSNDLDRLVDADEVELIDDGVQSVLTFNFSRMAMDSSGYHVGTERCRVEFQCFDASKMMYVNPQRQEDYPMHGIGITLDLADADFHLEPAREEISWDEIWRENAEAEHVQLLDEYKASLYTPAFVNQDDPDPLDEEDFCAWMKENHDIDIDREEYFDPYYPADEDFWFQEIEEKFEKLKLELRNTRWVFNPNHEKEESEPWHLETKSESSSLTP